MEFFVNCYYKLYFSQHPYIYICVHMYFCRIHSKTENFGSQYMCIFNIHIRLIYLQKIFTNLHLYQQNIKMSVFSNIYQHEVWLRSLIKKQLDNLKGKKKFGCYKIPYRNTQRRSGNFSSSQDKWTGLCKCSQNFVCVCMNIYMYLFWSKMVV